MGGPFLTGAVFTEIDPAECLGPSVCAAVLEGTYGLEEPPGLTAIVAVCLPPTWMTLGVTFGDFGVGTGRLIGVLREGEDLLAGDDKVSLALS